MDAGFNNLSAEDKISHARLPLKLAARARRLLPDRAGGRSVKAECASPHAVSAIDQAGLPLALRHGAPQPVILGRRRITLAVKRGMDIVLGALALVLLLPALLAVALAIKLDSRGPVLFRQMRPGIHGRPFALYKFRSLYRERCDPSGVLQVVADDARVTPVGRFLRRHSIDELPQLISVLIGDMSLIGPRPHPLGMRAGGVDYRQLVPYYVMRYAMKPGLSGWAQANGLRGPTTDAITARARIAHDIAYIQNFSVWLDIRIIVLTLRRVLFSGGGC